MKKRALLSLALILALLAALYLWYTRPRSFLAITGTSENAVCSAALLLLEPSRTGYLGASGPFPRHPRL